jgi:hypothetical protein
MDLTPLNMFRVVVKDCWSESIIPTQTQHSRRGLMWKKNEIIQLLSFPGGDLYIAKSLSFPDAGKHGEHHIWKREFRELTPEERKQVGLPSRVGAPIGEEDVPVHLVPEGIRGCGEDKGSFEAKITRRSRRY